MQIWKLRLSLVLNIVNVIGFLGMTIWGLWRWRSGTSGIPPEVIAGYLLFTMAGGEALLRWRRNRRRRAPLENTTERFIEAREWQLTRLQAVVGAVVCLYTFTTALFASPRAIAHLNYHVSCMALLALFVVASVDLWLLSWRVRQGHFGANGYEAREFLSFLFTSRDSNDTTTGLRLADGISVAGSTSAVQDEVPA
jgi:nicotinamide riboside transporter PnuC